MIKRTGAVGNASAYKDDILICSICLSFTQATAKTAIIFIEPQYNISMLTTGGYIHVLSLAKKFKLNIHFVLSVLMLIQTRLCVYEHASATVNIS